MTETAPTYILTAHCRSVLGTVDVVTRFLYEHQCYITEIQSFDDSEEEHFFIRVEFRNDGANARSIGLLREAFSEDAARFDMHWDIHDASTRPKVVMMVSRDDHCLSDLLYRYRTGHLNIEIPAIISNHPDIKHLAEWHGIPFYYLPVDVTTKTMQEQQVLDLLQQYRADLVVLARYMQVLSPELCAKLNGRAINIHHSLLPGFKGAKPYHQAWEKGVKLVGATAHYVTEHLDEGPIICQQVEAVDHSYTPKRLIERGQDTERLTLARAVRLHCEHRIFLHRNKTVIFEGS
ncbi:formyltetrahydrofolate deformylase [Marinobacterium rhizophilum]|uniref:Formyltetrahydrofolate deformylase n=1 Tax=Marinobacterium rhizophilum TaxID=420402 RepID=A0ABY5HIB8_9GAMM|nr:formyltetrahydrofolate deformylase [Marinobacterium rhizophilum]UTW12117.1 formyltetrahydrofolate deformylase [Marinobacterium rhizophilum]